MIHLTSTSFRFPPPTSSSRCFFIRLPVHQVWCVHRTPLLGPLSELRTGRSVRYSKDGRYISIPRSKDRALRSRSWSRTRTVWRARVRRGFRRRLQTRSRRRTTVSGRTKALISPSLPHPCIFLFFSPCSPSALLRDRANSAHSRVPQLKSPSLAHLTKLAIRKIRRKKNQ